MRRTVYATALALTVGCAPGTAPVAPAPAPAAAAPSPGPRLPLADRVRLAEAFRLANALGDGLWPGWSAAPFAVLVVTADREYLVRHPQPPADFMRSSYDSLLRSAVFERARVFQPHLLATFPLGGTPTIVVGSASATGKHSTAWVLTVLHEHFHQLQMSRGDYFSGVDALGLSRGDRTGMWMLDYPFPYDSARVQASFAAMAGALDSALAASTAASRQVLWRSVVDARGQLRAGLAPDDDRYLAFQMWQEGVARYTELRVARWAEAHFTSSDAFLALDDATSFGAAADSLEAGIRRGLRDNPLSRSRRVAFYPAGAALALLLDEVAPGWRLRYAASGFSLDGLLAESTSLVPAPR